MCCCLLRPNAEELRHPTIKICMQCLGRPLDRDMIEMGSCARSRSRHVFPTSCSFLCSIYDTHSRTGGSFPKGEISLAGSTVVGVNNVYCCLTHIDSIPITADNA